jgi:hypothetical protein
MSSKQSTGETKTDKSCGVCCEDFDNSSRKIVTCEFCDLSACRKCVKYYLTSKTDMANCMGCNKPWDRKFMQDALTKSYFNKGWKNHRKDMLFETEKARFPESMNKVELVLQIRKHETEFEEMKKEEQRLLLEWQKKKEEMNTMRGTINAIKYNNAFDKGPVKVFIKKCPADECNGFLSTGYKCGICEVRVCSKCNETMGYTPNCKDDHECDPNMVASAELIKQETKPCPQCAAPIFKINGCDQMWCTCCNIAFSWRTGMKVTGTIHNPHYYEFMRQNGGNAVQNPGAVNCGGLPYHDHMTRVTRKLENITNTIKDLNERHWLNDASNYLSMIHRGATHFQHIILDPIRRDIQRNNDNEDLRVKFIMNEIKEEQFKTNLIKRDNAFEKKQAMLHVYELMGNVFVETTISIYNLTVEFCKQIKTEIMYPALECTGTFIEEFKKMKQNLDKVRRYCNKELVRVSITYKQVVDVIDDIFHTPRLKQQECKKIMKIDNYTFVPMRDGVGRLRITKGRNYRSRRSLYKGLDVVVSVDMLVLDNEVLDNHGVIVLDI